MLLKSFEMDARRAGLTEGIQRGIQRGFADGSYQTKLQTAKNLTQMGITIETISKATGLTIEEIEAL